MNTLRAVFIGPHGLRAGWRLLCFNVLVGILGLPVTLVAMRVLGPEPPRWTPLVIIVAELVSLGVALLATLVMARVEHRTLDKYGVRFREAFGRRFREGALWGLLSISAVVLMMAAAGGYQIVGWNLSSQDKMEQLLALDFNDGATNTTVYPAQATGGTGLGGTMAGATTVGGTTPSSPVTSYVDYLDATGTLLPNATGAYFTRQWSISADATAKLKTITVMTWAITAGAGRGPRPSTTLVCLKTAPQ
jgi:hypothetical protein